MEWRFVTVSTPQAGPDNDEIYIKAEDLLISD